MKINERQNYNISMRAGLYFSKPGVLFNPNVNYVNPKGQKITERGVRYFENTKLDENIQKKISEIPFVKKLSEKYETFVSVIQSKSKNGNPYGKIEIQYADYKKKKVKTYEAYGILTREFKQFLDERRAYFGIKIPEKLENPIDIAIAKIQNGMFD